MIKFIFYVGLEVTAYAELRQSIDRVFKTFIADGRCLCVITNQFAMICFIQMKFVQEWLG